MLECISHRGPDGVRQVIRDGRVGLGHRRLAVIDLSMDASQPMRSESGCEVILNGEIYNYLELRAELASGELHSAPRVTPRCSSPLMTGGGSIASVT